MTLRRARQTTLAGSAILAGTALWHATGFPSVATAATESTLGTDLVGVFKGLWLYPSYHWLFVALLAACTARFPPGVARIVLALASLVLAADVVLLLIFVGPFMGELLLGLSAVAFAVATRLYGSAEEPTGSRKKARP